MGTGYHLAVRVIGQSTLEAFWKEHADAEQALRAWCKETEAADWKTTIDIQGSHPKASILKRGRVVFNVCGNKHRLVVRFYYPYAYVCFIGTHSDYDRIDAQTVWNH
jgi:mRNA interferase HigB